MPLLFHAAAADCYAIFHIIGYHSLFTLLRRHLMLIRFADVIDAFAAAMPDEYDTQQTMFYARASCAMSFDAERHYDDS